MSEEEVIIIIRSSPSLFKKDTWKSRTNPELREWLLSQFNSYTSKFTFSDPVVPIMPMFHGTNKDIPWKIAQTGFTTVATLDNGWYGRGIYFTSHMAYAKYYSKCSLNNPPTPDRYILVALVLPGNPYPVIEHPEGAGSIRGVPGVVETGYQSHYVCVDTTGTPLTNIKTKQYFDELVVFQDNQALPMYLLVVQ